MPGNPEKASRTHDCLRRGSSQAPVSSGVVLFGERTKSCTPSLVSAGGAEQTSLCLAGPLPGRGRAASPQGGQPGHPHPLCMSARRGARLGTTGRLRPLLSTSWGHRTVPCLSVLTCKVGCPVPSSELCEDTEAPKGGVLLCGAFWCQPVATAVRYALKG